MPAGRGEPDTAVETVAVSPGRTNATASARMPAPVTVSVPDQARKSHNWLVGTSAYDGERVRARCDRPEIHDAGACTRRHALGREVGPAIHAETDVDGRAVRGGGDDLRGERAVGRHREVLRRLAGRRESRLQGETPTSNVAAPAGAARVDPAAARTAATSVEAGERFMGKLPDLYVQLTLLAQRPYPDKRRIGPESIIGTDESPKPVRMNDEPSSPREVTRLLAAWGQGDPLALEKLTQPRLWGVAAPRPSLHGRQRAATRSRRPHS